MLTRNLQRKQEAAAIRDSGWSFVAGRADRLVAPAEGVTGSQGDHSLLGRQNVPSEPVAAIVSAEKAALADP